MNEFKLIESILAPLTANRAVQGVALGAGDDAALLAGGPWPLVTVDTMVEGIHWDPALVGPVDVGFKLLATNLSDIAAMGGIPGPMLLAFSLREESCHGWVEQVVDGLVEARRVHGLAPDLVAPIGGDITRVRGPQVLTLVLFGRETCPGRILRRSDALVGDGIWVTGPLGSAALGLEVLRSGRGDAPRFQPFVEKHRRPRARLDVGCSLARLAGVHAAIDLSDGLAGDLRHILARSGVGAEIVLEALPREPGLEELADGLGLDPWTLMLSGGEDYELLVTAEPSLTGSLESLGMSWIGRILSGASLVVRNPEGQTQELDLVGYTHF